MKVRLNYERPRAGRSRPTMVSVAKLAVAVVLLCVTSGASMTLAYAMVVHGLPDAPLLGWIVLGAGAGNLAALYACWGAAREVFRPPPGDEHRPRA
jgi:hypothetical protein